MSLCQRPATRFFAAFYRWNLQHQTSRICAISTPRNQHGARYIRDANTRGYYASHLLQQSEMRSDPQHEPSAAQTEDVYGFLEEVDSGDQDNTRRAANAQPEPESEPQPVSESGPKPEVQETIADIDDSNPEIDALRSSVRVVMRNVPSSAAIVTVACIDPETNKRIPVGAAISSLTTVSMDPPMISFNLKEPSKTLSAIREANGLFRIHITSANRGGASIVELFTRGNDAAAYSKRRKNLKRLWMPRNKKEESQSESLAPQIWDDDVQAAMECRVTQEIPVADHVILVAKISSVHKKDVNIPGILYVRGAYTRVEGTQIAVHTATPPVEIAQEVQTLWDCPRFPGEEDRRQYVEHIKSLVKSNKSYMEPGKSSIKRLASALPYHPRALGINLYILVAECKRELGLPNPQLPASQMEMPILNEFYGRISPASREKLIDRAKKLVSQDIGFLSLQYGALMQHLSASNYLKDFLPSDIMRPLREAGLVGTIGYQSKGTDNDIYKLEQIENNLVQYLRTLEFSEVLTTSMDDLLRRCGADVGAATYFKSSRSRLLAMTHPKVYNRDTLDISGHVNAAEERVIIRRLIHFLFPSNYSQYRKNRTVDPNEMLRRIHVHPVITGMDIEFLVAKIEHLFQSTQRFIDFAPKVYGLLDNWLDKRLEWFELQDRVKQFVHNMPLRATTWDTVDQMAAMGIHQNAKVSVPGQEWPQSVGSGALLATLVAKELKNFYGTTGTQRENMAIAKFLKDAYDYDVHPKPGMMAQSGVEGMDGVERDGSSSGSEMREAMLANLNVDISKRDRKTDSE
ncbi:hypothetical protein IAQ61_010368 [Plenodomus lingam]|nr:hypothetical protein IAQ61_010368 [Plenodomus lingam]